MAVALGTLARRRRTALAAIARREWLLSLMALAAAGCRRAEDRAYTRGNTLIVGVDGYDNDRPLSVDEYAEYLAFLPLVRLDERGERQPRLATHWTHSSDYLEWTYRLRPGVRWHDGRPVTVDDVRFTIDLHGAYTPPIGLAGTTCTVHDDTTFTVRGVEWTRGSPVDSYMSILPKHLLKDLDYQRFYEWDFWLRPVGCGPYRFLRYQPATMVELEANPEYYKGKPPIERVVLKFTKGASVTELLGGNVDAIWMNDTVQLRAITNDPRFQTYWELANDGNNSLMVIVWQHAHPLFRDRNIRRAVSLAIDRRELLQVLNLPREPSLVDEVSTPRQARRGEASEPRYDRAEAERVLDAAGWARRRDGLRERAGQECRFTALVQAGSPIVGSCTQASLVVQDHLRDLGVRMDLQPLERGVLQSKMKAREFDAALCSSRIMGGDLESLMGEESPYGYRNPQLTKLLETVRTTPDPDAADEAHREISELIRRDQPVTVLCRGVRAHVVHRRLKGLRTLWRADPLGYLEDLWIEG